MATYDLSPLLTIPAPLFQALRTSPSYLEMATGLLRDTLAFDFHLATASQVEVTGRRKDFYLNCGAIERESAYETFLSIRNRKTAVENDLPLLFHVASLLDYTAQLTINMLPMIDNKVRHYASSVEGDLAFPWSNPQAVEHAISVYLGLSPFPFFLNDFNPASHANERLLSPYGFGVYTYLSLAVIPELALRGGVPEDILGQWSARPIARGGIRNLPDGSFKVVP